MRPALLFGFLGAAVSSAAATETEPVHEIGISADVPTIQVSPRRAGRVTMRLPTLTYALRLTVECDKDWQPESVSISVADSRAALNAEQLRASRELELELKIPSIQIAPLRVERFCIAGDTMEVNRITIPGVVSAQASLRCSIESTHTIIYATKPLDLVLECDDAESADH